MHVRARTTNRRMALRLCSLEFVWSLDGRVVIQNTSEERGPQLIFEPQVFAEWASQNVEGNIQPEGRTYGYMHAGHHIAARLVTTVDVASEFVHKKGVWCVWHQGQAKLCFDFTRHEANALIAAMGSPEYVEFMANAPASVSS